LPFKDQQLRCGIMNGGGRSSGTVAGLNGSPKKKNLKKKLHVVVAVLLGVGMSIGKNRNVDGEEEEEGAVDMRVMKRRQSKIKFIPTI